MSGISSKAAGGIDNRRKYNGIEFDEDLDLDTYEAYYRNLDPQTGRWWQIDPKVDEGMENVSPYASMYDDPIRNSDFLGDEPDGDGIFSRLGSAVVESVQNASAGLLGAANAYASDNLGGIGLSDGSNLSGSNGDAFRNGQNVGHIAAIVTGALEDVGAGVSAVFTGGASAPVSIPLAIHGTATTAIAIKNLAIGNNPYGSRGKPDHQQKVDDLNKKAQREAKPGETVLRERKVQGQDSRRKPDVQIVDKNGKTRKVFEAERKPNSQRNIKREKEYKKLNVDQETHKVGS